MGHHVLLVFGFLGSGKTTFIIQLAECFARYNKRAALIVNEVGEIGIDNQYMKQLGYNVWEIFGGCICCTLSSSLENTLEELEKNYNPDMIIIEPSGAAEPKTIYDTLVYAGLDQNKIHNFFVLDPTRIDMFEEILSPLLFSSLKLSDIVIINKLDLADREAVGRCTQHVNIHTIHNKFFLIERGNHFPVELESYILDLVDKG
ncbi:GTP-binding protein [Geosporobacter ferrireducens]|uniref:Cobalamin biosynthesis protein P47K n=1 Tax=Geosporobacter ferrireducens TaxID=1424294 RepID=A0A1D8GJ95_9FIRM|nr:GTP-binding protein [Geosporobacter ferrireducens]AOT70991.1 cobalamin biosynthesis protein P47K [Geosporobacter ferrireducens]MTI53709.1 GTP-binding protein [Geosporobacter ferrireducens]